ncbi:MAG TPA: hypothetical protein VK969_03305 [Acidimicrobiia bacterium]|nr:hypothetical protein [Acidimicrobiia bacterium]
MALSTMYLRALLTVASLTVATVAVLIVECWSTVINFSTSDPLGICSTMVSLGIDYGLGTGIGLALLAVLALIVTWVPAAQPKSVRRKLVPVVSLRDNLDRLVDFGIQTREVDDTIPSGVHMARLTRRLEAIELAVANSSMPSRETTRQWIRLLVEANDLHNTGQLDTQHFSEINTRGLDLFRIPDESDEMSGASSG